MLRTDYEPVRSRTRVYTALEEVVVSRLLGVLTLLIFAGAVTFAQMKVAPNSKLFIAPMEGNLHGFIAAEIVKKKVPLVVVVEEEQADYILTGGSIAGENKWYHSVFGGRDRNEGNVQLISVKDKQLVWAGEAGDRSLWWGSIKRGGQRKIADRLVKRMKEDLFKR